MKSVLPGSRLEHDGLRRHQTVVAVQQNGEQHAEVIEIELAELACRDGGAVDARQGRLPLLEGAPALLDVVPARPQPLWGTKIRSAP